MVDAPYGFIGGGSFNTMTNVTNAVIAGANGTASTLMTTTLPLLEEFPTTFISFNILHHGIWL